MMARRLALLGLLAGALAGCAAPLLGGPKNPEEARLEEARRFVSQTEKVYGLWWPITLNVGDDSPSLAVPRLRVVVLSQPALRGPYWRAILAHELGHILLGHGRGGDLERLEVEAFVKGVEILQRVAGLSEDEAVREIDARLMDFDQRVVESGLVESRGLMMGRGHRHCGERRDVLARFPAYMGPAASGCARTK